MNGQDLLDKALQDIPVEQHPAAVQTLMQACTDWMPADANSAVEPVIAQLVGIARQVRHSGTYGQLWFNPVQRAVWWTGAENDFDEDAGMTSYEWLEDQLSALPEILDVHIEAEMQPVDVDSEDGHQAWQEIMFMPDEEVLEWQRQQDPDNELFQDQQRQQRAAQQEKVLLAFLGQDILDLSMVQEQLSKSKHPIVDRDYLHGLLEEMSANGELTKVADGYRLSR